MIPRDPCAQSALDVSNQLDALFNIDDLMMTRSMSQIVAKCVKKLDGSYRCNDTLAAIRGKTRKFLDLTIDFRALGTCVLN